MLRAKGSGAHITNAGVFGDTTGQVLARLSSAVPDGTKVVILGIGAFNDVRTGGSADVARTNIAAIKRRLAGRGIRVVDAFGTLKSGLLFRRLRSQLRHVLCGELRWLAAESSRDVIGKCCGSPHRNRHCRRPASRWRRASDAAWCRKSPPGRH